MKKTLLILSILSLVFIYSCGDDDSSPTIVASFQVAEDEGDEDVGTVSIEVTLSGETSNSLELPFEISGDASLNGDYRVITPSPITIPAGSTTASIELSIVDDDVIEALTIQNQEVIEIASKDIEITLTTGESDLSIDETANTFTYSIIDDDFISTSGMKCDLIWTVQGTNNSDQVNLDMLAVYDVIIENGVIDTLSIYEGDAGINTSGFESLTIDASAPDGEYYISLSYTGGSGTAQWEFFGFPSDISVIVANGDFQEADQDFSLIVGPLVEKSGSDFARFPSGTLRLPVQKVLIPDGLLGNN